MKNMTLHLTNIWYKNSWNLSCLHNILDIALSFWGQDEWVSELFSEWVSEWMEERLTHRGYAFKNMDAKFDSPF